MVHNTFTVLSGDDFMNISNLDKTVNFIGIDRDSNRVFDLLLTYFKAKKMFPKAEIVARLSPSRRGFHIIIKKKNTILENFFYRSILNDDAERIRLNMEKFALNNDEVENDLLFTSKGKKKIKELNMNAIIEGHETDIKDIEENWGTNNGLEKIETLSKKVEKEIPTKKVWICSIGFNGEALREKIKKICSDTNVKDETFRYKIYQSYFPKYEYLLVIFGNRNKDQSMQRGAWFKKILKKEFNVDILYYVKEKIET